MPQRSEAGLRLGRFCGCPGTLVQGGLGIFLGCKQESFSFIARCCRPAVDANVSGTNASNFVARANGFAPNNPKLRGRTPSAKGSEVQDKTTYLFAHPPPKNKITLPRSCSRPREGRERAGRQSGITRSPTLSMVRGSEGRLRS